MANTGLPEPQGRNEIEKRGEGETRGQSASCGNVPDTMRIGTASGIPEQKQREEGNAEIVNNNNCRERERDLLNTSEIGRCGSKHEQDKGGARDERQAASIEGGSLQNTGSGYWPVEPAVGRLAHGLSTVLDGNLRRLYNADVNDSETISKIDNYYKSILFGMRIKRKTSTSSCGGKSGFSYSLVSKMPYEITHDEWYMGKWIEKDEVLCNMWKDVLSGEENIQDLLTEMSVRIRENQRNEKMASKRVDRLQGLGNAIVPQIAELLFRQIKQFIQE
jgi:hypothetical protein